MQLYGAGLLLSFCVKMMLGVVSMFKKKEEKFVTRVIDVTKSNKLILFQLDDKTIGNDNKWIKLKKMITIT